MPEFITFNLYTNVCARERFFNCRYVWGMGCPERARGPWIHGFALYAVFVILLEGGPQRINIKWLCFVKNSAMGWVILLSRVPLNLLTALSFSRPRMLKQGPKEGRMLSILFSTKVFQPKLDMQWTILKNIK